MYKHPSPNQSYSYAVLVVVVGIPVAYSDRTLVGRKPARARGCSLLLLLASLPRAQVRSNLHLQTGDYSGHGDLLDEAIAIGADWLEY
jgi:hypothetical protein